MMLVPLHPFTYEFTAETGKGRIDYFFVAHPRRDDSAFRSSLRELVEAQRSDSASGYALYSLYVYEQAGDIGESFTGQAHDLRGTYDQLLVSFTRWRQGELDVFYLIKDGSVVFDLLKDAPVSPSFEFD